MVMENSLNSFLGGTLYSRFSTDIYTEVLRMYPSLSGKPGEVQYLHPAYRRMQADWFLADILIGGTRYVQTFGEEFIDRFFGEETSDLQKRVRKLFFIAFFSLSLIHI